MKRGIHRVKDPTGRLDWLVAKLLERVIEQQADPVLTAAYAELRQPVELLFREKLGPRNPQAREIGGYIRYGGAAVRAVAAKRGL